MDVKLPPYPDYHGEPTQIADAYRVALWEQPEDPVSAASHPTPGWRSITSRVSLQMG